MYLFDMIPWMVHCQQVTHKTTFVTIKYFYSPNGHFLGHLEIFNFSNLYWDPLLANGQPCPQQLQPTLSDLLSHLPPLRH